MKVKLSSSDLSDRRHLSFYLHRMWFYRCLTLLDQSFLLARTRLAHHYLFHATLFKPCQIPILPQIYLYIRLPSIITIKIHPNIKIFHRRPLGNLFHQYLLIRSLSKTWRHRPSLQWIWYLLIRVLHRLFCLFHQLQKKIAQNWTSTIFWSLQRTIENPTHSRFVNLRTLFRQLPIRFKRRVTELVLNW